MPFSGSTVDRHSILAILGMGEAKLPIRYLGLPLFSTRLQAVNCTPLLSKIRAKLSGWNGASLSFAGRTKLLRSTINNFHTFWATAFLLPVSCMEKIERMMRDFLWGSTHMRKIHTVCWEKICRPKNKGGLGLRPFRLINQACLMKQIWNIANSKEDLWTKWIHAKYLRGRNIWECVLGTNPSWAWRSIFSVRDKTKLHTIHAIGNGANTSFWRDPWLLPGFILLEQFGHLPIYDLGLGRNVKVCDLICDGVWNLPPPASQTLSGIWTMIRNISLPLCCTKGEILWTGDDQGILSIASALNHHLLNIPEPSWVQLVWFPGCIPRHST